MRDLDQEVFKVILLNGQNHILNILEVAKGSLTAARVYPREVVKIALRYSAAALVFVHNHPSGVAKPSEDDKRITRDLALACLLIGIKVHDHIIIGDNDKFSFADAGLKDPAAYEKGTLGRITEGGRVGWNSSRARSVSGISPGSSQSR
jgi:DNA repair protein RadC